MGGLITENAPWAIKTATVIDHRETAGGETTFKPVTLEGFAHDPSSFTTNTAAPSGVVQLVTPTQVTTDLPLGTNDKVGAGSR